MKRLLAAAFILICVSSYGQDVVMTGTASAEQVWGEVVESDVMPPMNELNMESGYALYSASVTTDVANPVLELENVRDYAAVYLDGVLQGSLTDANKKIVLMSVPGVHRLELYAENIGRITYGPEILDNYKGLFGRAVLDGKEVENWMVRPLCVRQCDVGKLEFSENTDCSSPCFYRGFFEFGQPHKIYLDISGWGMGEVWLNGKYAGSYWEDEKQQSILLSVDDLCEGHNEIIVFELKNNGLTAMKLSDRPAFK